MILAENFFDYLLKTERDFGIRVLDRYAMYLKSQPEQQLPTDRLLLTGATWLVAARRITHFPASKAARLPYWVFTSELHL